MEAICIEEVVSNLLEVIKKAKEGEEFTTACLLIDELGQDWLDKSDFSTIMEIEEGLFEESKKLGIVLDKGDTEQIVGLPQNIPFVVRKNACDKEIDETGYIPKEYL